MKMLIAAFNVNANEGQAFYSDIFWNSGKVSKIHLSTRSLRNSLRRMLEANFNASLVYRSDGCTRSTQPPLFTSHYTVMN